MYVHVHSKTRLCKRLFITFEISGSDAIRLRNFVMANFPSSSPSSMLTSSTCAPLSTCSLAIVSASWKLHTSPNNHLESEDVHCIMGISSHWQYLATKRLLFVLSPTATKMKIYETNKFQLKRHAKYNRITGNSPHETHFTKQSPT